MDYPPTVVAAGSVLCGTRASDEKRQQLSMARGAVLCASLRSQVEKAMATHSSTLAWKIPWAEEPGRLQSMSHPGERLDKCPADSPRVSADPLEDLARFRLLITNELDRMSMSPDGWAG